MTSCLPEHLLPSLLLIALPLHIVDPQSQVMDLTLSALQKTKVGVVSVSVLHKTLQQINVFFWLLFTNILRILKWMDAFQFIREQRINASLD